MGTSPRCHLRWGKSLAAATAASPAAPIFPGMSAAQGVKTACYISAWKCQYAVDSTAAAKFQATAKQGHLTANTVSLQSPTAGSQLLRLFSRLIYKCKYHRKYHCCISKTACPISL